MLVHLSSIHRKAGVNALSPNIINTMLRCLSRRSIDTNIRRKRNSWAQWKNGWRKVHRLAACDGTHQYQVAIGKNNRYSLTITAASIAAVITTTWSINQLQRCGNKPSQLTIRLHQPSLLLQSAIAKTRQLESGKGQRIKYQLTSQDHAKRI